MSRRGSLNRYYVRIYPEKPKVAEKTCYTWLVSATTKSSALKQAGGLAFKFGIEARQITIFGLIIPKSQKRRQKMIDDYARERQELVKLKKLAKQASYPIKY